jgi:hypothetical protein
MKLKGILRMPHTIRRCLQYIIQCGKSVESPIEAKLFEAITSVAGRHQLIMMATLFLGFIMEN